MSNGYGIDSINALGSDPMFVAALQAYNPNFRGTQQVAATDAPYVQKPEVTQSQPAQQVRALQADYTEEDSNALAWIGGAVGASALVGGLDIAFCKGKHLKKIGNFFKGKAEKAADALKSNRAMKEFRFKAKDGSQIFVKDGKVVNIIEKVANKEIKDAKEIQKILTEKGINQADLLNYKKLKDVVFKEYSFETTYNGRTILVENGKITKINNVTSSDVIKDIGGQNKYDNFMKNIVEIVEKGQTPKSRNKINKLDIKSYEWSQDGITGTVIKGEKGKYRLGDSVTQKGELKTLSETERNAYLENHKELNTTVQSLIEKGHAEGVNVARNISFDPKGNKLYINKKGDIIGVELKDAIKDSAGNDVKVLKDGKDRTLLDSWLYNNPEAKEFAKKEFDSGLARDGATFYLS